MDDATKRCPFCGSDETSRVSEFGTSLMVALHKCARCNTYFEAIKWGDRAARLDVPPFLDEPAQPRG